MFSLNVGIVTRPDDYQWGGVLRALYEVNPVAYIVEQAGGAAVTPGGRALDVQIDELHQRSAIVLGSQEDVAIFSRDYS